MPISQKGKESTEVPSSASNPAVKATPNKGTITAERGGRTSIRSGVIVTTRR